MPSSGTHSDQHSRSRSFAIRKAVLVKNFGNGPKWLRGRITHCIGPLSYRVFLRDGGPQFLCEWRGEVGSDGTSE